MRGRLSVVAAIAAGAMCTGASAQVVINEVMENPPGSGSTDDVWEFIELYGKPNMDLTGYAIALIKGGVDQDGNNIPDPPPAQESVAEIDEAYSLDGVSLGANGLLLLYQSDDVGISLVMGEVTDPDTNIASLKSLHIPTTDTPGKLANDNSSSYVLVRRRPNHSIDEMTGESVYDPGYSFRKDINPDVDFDGKTDCGMETPVGGAPAALVVEAYQMVDDVAWSNNGGKEYVRNSEQEISDAPGFNPDAICRVNFFGENPELGARFKSDMSLAPTRMADEEWIYGDLLAVTGVNKFKFNNTIDGDGFIQVKGPTDPAGPTYDGTCNPDDPMSGCMPAPGPYLFEDINLNGYKVTPGALNNVNGIADGGIVITQFQFVKGDFNFDGVADRTDFGLICPREGATLDDQEMGLCSDGVTPIMVYTYEGRAFQALLAMLDMDETDGMGGANAAAVTDADVTAHRVFLGFGEAPDQDGDGVIGATDLAELIGRWGSDDPIADLDKSGEVGASDLATLIGTWGPLD